MYLLQVDAQTIALHLWPPEVREGIIEPQGLPQAPRAQPAPARKQSTAAAAAAAAGVGGGQRKRQREGQDVALQAGRVVKARPVVAQQAAAARKMEVGVDGNRGTAGGGAAAGGGGGGAAAVSLKRLAPAGGAQKDGSRLATSSSPAAAAGRPCLGGKGGREGAEDGGWQPAARGGSAACLLPPKLRVKANAGGVMNSSGMAGAGEGVLPGVQRGARNVLEQLCPHYDQQAAAAAGAADEGGDDDEDSDSGGYVAVRRRRSSGVVEDSSDDSDDDEGSAGRQQGEPSWSMGGSGGGTKQGSSSGGTIRKLMRNGSLGAARPGAVGDDAGQIRRSISVPASGAAGGGVGGSSENRWGGQRLAHAASMPPPQQQKGKKQQLRQPAQPVAPLQQQQQQQRTGRWITPYLYGYSPGRVLKDDKRRELKSVGKIAFPGDLVRVCYGYEGEQDVKVLVMLYVPFAVKAQGFEAAASGPWKLQQEFEAAAVAAAERGEGGRTAAAAAGWPGVDMVRVHCFPAHLKKRRNNPTSMLARLDRYMKGFVGWRLVGLETVSGSNLCPGACRKRFTY